MPEGGQVTIRAENALINPAEDIALDPGSYLKITITDQGIEVLHEYLQDIFDPYFLSSRERSGLILATAYAVIKNHRGMISVESEFENGTSFFIYLPVLSGDYSAELHSGNSLSHH